MQNTYQWPFGRFDSVTMQLLDAMLEGIMVIDADSRIVYVNPAYMRILGPHHYRVGDRLSEVSPHSRLLWTLRTGQPVNMQVQATRWNVDLVLTCVPVVEKGVTVGACAVFRQVSDVLRIHTTVERLRKYAMDLRKSDVEVSGEPFQRILGISPKIKDAVNTARRVAPLDVTVVLRGESGVGKELMAQAVHQGSQRARKPFVAMNCAAVPEALLESELFGYAPGSFTGANKDGKPGKFQAADGGTLFLDEVGDMSLAMQSKLLRVLQESEVEPVGSFRPMRIDVRVIAATNRNLEQMVSEGQFREDLYYRLNVVSITIPPLRERGPQDTDLLVATFLNYFNTLYHRSLVISPEVWKIFRSYPWPGNVRQLSNCVEHAVILAEGAAILPGDLPPQLLAQQWHSLSTVVSPAPAPKPELPLAEAVADKEKQLIEEALARHGGNRSLAMKSLGLPRTTFYARLRKYGLLDH